MSVVHDIRTWGSGCKCCEELRRSGVKVNCPRQGKRLLEVRERLQDFDKLCELKISGPLDGDACEAVDLPNDLRKERVSAFDRLRVTHSSHFVYLDMLPTSLGFVKSVEDLLIENENGQMGRRMLKIVSHGTYFLQKVTCDIARSLYLKIFLLASVQEISRLQMEICPI